MFHHFLRVAALSLTLTQPALAQTPPSLTDRLTRAEAPFEQGALQALIAFERLMQSNYDYGIGQGLTPATRFILGPRATTMPNPAPKPLKADSFVTVIKTFAADLDTARSTLGQTPSVTATPFTLDLGALWFDVNGNGQFENEEAALPWIASIAPRAQGAGDQPEGPIELRFDAADHAWLMAYTHVLSASAEAILTFDPTPVFADLLAAEARLTDLPELPYDYDVTGLNARINALVSELEAMEAERDRMTKVRNPLQAKLNALRQTIRSTEDDSARAALQNEAEALQEELKSPAFDITPLRRETSALRRQIAAARAKLPPEDMDEVTRGRQQSTQLMREPFREPLNMIYSVLTTLRQQPDPVHLARFETHLREMLTHNRRFWDLVTEETDNDREWVPNSVQTSALGFEIPEQMARDWQAILADMEAVLDGRLLIPHPMMPHDIGINLAAWFDDPSSLDLVAWLHGVGATPYLTRGPRITEESWIAFQRSTGGNGFGFALFLN